MQLHPREQFTITRQLNDPAIVTTFYVRAVIRNAKTDTVIDTVNLTDKTGQRFTKQWLVPADPSGQGFWISIVTSVYTDSGYTTKSTDYGDEACSYLVQERYVFNPNYPVGPDIDYKRIKKMIDDAVSKIEIPVYEEREAKVIEVVKEVAVSPEINIDMGPILTAIKNIKLPKETVRVVETFKEINLDLSPVLKSIKEIKIPEPYITDLSGIVKSLDVIEKLVTPKVEEVDEEDIRVSRILGKKELVSPYSDRIKKLINK
jgi:hypothetical protein